MPSIWEFCQQVNFSLNIIFQAGPSAEAVFFIERAGPLAFATSDPHSLKTAGWFGKKMEKTKGCVRFQMMSRILSESIYFLFLYFLMVLFKLWIV